MLPKFFVPLQILLFPENLLLKHIKKLKSCLTENAFCHPQRKSWLRAWLKQGSRTHSLLRQRCSQLQKYKAARMSRRIAVNQKVCSWVGGHPGLTVWNLLNFTRIENPHKVRRIIFVFHYVAVICTITKREEQIRTCVSRYDQSAWTANSWRSSKRSTYCKHRCATLLAQETKRETSHSS